MAGVGKFFIIKSQMNDKVLSVEGACMQPGVPVGPWPFTGEDHQLWFEDRIDGVIRCKADDTFVFELADEQLTINEFNPDEYNQKWKCTSNMIVHTEDGNCLDIAGMDDSDGAKVCAWEEHGGENQLWTFDHMAPQYCYIVSQLDQRVLDIRDADTSPGAKVICWTKHGEEADNQLWYEDKYGHIRTKLNDFVIDTTEGSGRMQEADHDVKFRNWVKRGSKIVNRIEPEICLQVMDAGDQGMRKHWKGRKLDAAEYIGADHQKWEFDYI